MRIEHIHIGSDAQAVIEIFSLGGRKMNEGMAAELLWVLVEGPGPGDAEFLGRWLLAAVEADQELQKQYERDTNLRNQIARLEVAYIISFSPAATKIVELLMR